MVLTPEADLLVSAASRRHCSQEGKFNLVLPNRQFTRLAIWAVFFAVLFLSPHSPAEAATITTKHFLIDYAEISKPEALSFGKTADRAYEMVTEFLGGAAGTRISPCEAHPHVHPAAIPNPPHSDLPLEG